jgi:cytochrome P450
LKRLSDTPTAQTKLRAALRNAYAAATAEERTPTANEITKTQIPYLDAILEEIVRMALTASGVARVALSDTVVLGHHIPKGTDVFMLWNGPDYFEKSFQIEDSVRSETSRSPKGRQVGSWDPATMKSFQPERWLATDDAGNEVYDPLAGPHLSFGLGPRGCYGKRLAYLELRMIIVMIIWNFELQMCPEALSDYEAVDRLTRQPRKCFVKLEKAGF